MRGLRAVPGAPEEELLFFKFLPCWDWSGRAVITTLENKFPNLIASDLPTAPRVAHFTFATQFGPMMITVSRARVSASNPHQLLVLMLVTSALIIGSGLYSFARERARARRTLAKAPAAG